MFFTSGRNQPLQSAMGRSNQRLRDIKMNRNILLGLGICGLLTCLSAPATAQFTSYDNPNATWLGSTTGVNIVGNETDTVRSIGGGAFSIDFDKDGFIGNVGGDWQPVWSSAPYSALNQGDATLYWSEATDFTFSSAVTSFGFELQTIDLMDNHDIMVQFYNGSTLIGSINRTIDNSGVMADGWDTTLGGARLFAGSYDAGITSVRVLSSDDYGFSAGGFRYAGLGGNNNVTNNSAVPEPGEWAAMAMMLTGLGGLVVRARRRRA
jgi:MYXO-CTERM domain-containing protein